jgi:hypothetical protein
VGERIRKAMATPCRPGIRGIAKQFGVSPMTVQNVTRARSSGVSENYGPRASRHRPWHNAAGPHLRFVSGSHPSAWDPLRAKPLASGPMATGVGACKKCEKILSLDVAKTRAR